MSPALRDATPLRSSGGEVWRTGTRGAAISNPDLTANNAVVTLVVPMRNERHRFGGSVEPLIRFIRAQPPGSQLVYVDDGSDDGTPRLVADFVRCHPSDPVRLIERLPAGKGAAVQAGLATATAGVAAFCDIDLATPLEDLRRIIEAASRAPVLAIGSRDLATSSIVRHESGVRETLGKVYNRAVQLTVAPGIVDTQCGAKAARAEVWG
ncbi:MAG: glycosyltransferase, partial [Actinobacteria bacterium]|nr:glycosyltransferase [Actinomycetota bacterium]